jgi:hypothetical protein
VVRHRRQQRRTHRHAQGGVLTRKRGWAAAALAVAALPLSFVASAASPDVAGEYRDGAPPGFSGGFGEDSCRACHFEAELNQAPGSVAIRGVPVRWQPGRTYALVVELERPELTLAGFQLTARFEDGSQAGGLVPGPEDGAGVTISTKSDTGVQYAHQTGGGAVAFRRGMARWTVHWAAPSPDPRAVLFHVAANAADGDDSAGGDFVYTAAAASLAP